MRLGRAQQSALRHALRSFKDERNGGWVSYGVSPHGHRKSTVRSLARLRLVEMQTGIFGRGSGHFRLTLSGSIAAADVEAKYQADLAEFTARRDARLAKIGPGS